jgi:hypothetical protein
LIYAFICLVTDLVLIWLLWVHQERTGYVALIAYFVAICVLSSIMQQIYHYAYYEDFMWAQLDHIKHQYTNPDVIFKNGNYGFALVLANIRYFCYNVESTYLLTYTLHISLSVYGFWAGRRRAERIYSVLAKVLPILLTGITTALQYTPVAQSSWRTYMLVANAQGVIGCAASIPLVILILWKYIDSRSLWRKLVQRPQARSASSWMSGSSSAQTPEAQKHGSKLSAENTWLILRLSTAVFLISGFILSTVLTHLGSPEEIARKAKSDEPDMSPSHARSNIIGYIYGVTPGLAIPLIFGLTRPFRQTLYKTFVPETWQRTADSGAEEQARAQGWISQQMTPLATPDRIFGSETRDTRDNPYLKPPQTGPRGANNGSPLRGEDVPFDMSREAGQRGRSWSDSSGTGTKFGSHSSTESNTLLLKQPAWI